MDSRLIHYLTRMEGDEEMNYLVKIDDEADGPDPVITFETCGGRILRYPRSQLSFLGNFIDVLR